MNRSHAPLVRAKDALYIDSTELGIDEVVGLILRAVSEHGIGARPVHD